MATASPIRYTAPIHSIGPTGPRFGDYEGLSAILTPPPHDGLTAPVSQFLRHKRWMYTFVASDDILVTCAIVDAGPTGTAFITVADRRTGHLLADVSRPGGLRPLVGVNDRPGDGHSSRYRMPGTDVSMRTEDGRLRVRAKVGSPIGLPALGKPAIELDLTFDITAMPALTVISELQTDPPSVSTTGKNAALPVSGRVTVRLGGFVHDFTLIDALGGFDYTSGHLPRHTQWRWSYFTGRLQDGRPIGMNVTSGFSGLTGRCRENSVWLDGRLHAVDPDAQIEFDTEDPGKPWHVSTQDGAVALEFHPIGVHRESLNLRLIRSHFLQPVGEFTGTVRVAGEQLTVERMPGVVENQDILW
jgi:hypothetical protein